MFNGVAAAILAAVEGGILPPRKNARSAGQDARLYGRRDARRYAAKYILTPLQRQELHAIRSCTLDTETA
ncbi:MAG: hypothetical protein DME19_09740 [Verrucomicrobia bacterium]|nr:MAG: hypothetical protein DME19_09740 [Verrucomicrobiota bacterium]